MTTRWTNKRPRDEDSETHEFDSSDSDDVTLGFSADDNPLAQGKKRTKLEPSNTDVARSTALKKLQTAPKGSIGVPAVRALLAKSGSLSKFTTASRETNSGLRKAGRAASGRKTSNAKGKERAARWELATLLIGMTNLNACYNRKPTPPVREKKMKVAVIIFLHKGVASVS